MAQQRPSVATTEQDCADLCGYDYISENLISAELGREQERHIRQRGVLDAGGLYPPPCACDKTPGHRWCCDESCSNWSNKVACSPECGEGCHNNPFKNNGQGFTAGRQTYLDQITGKGVGIFALSPIKKDSFIGQYTGQVHASADVRNSGSEYLMDYNHVKQTIDGREFGSICTRINHSCDPNCIAYSYVHQNRYKIVYLAKRDISKDEELTVNYGWTFEKGDTKKFHVCLCGVKELGEHTIEKMMVPRMAYRSRLGYSRNKLITEWSTSQLDIDQPLFETRQIANENRLFLSVRSPRRPSNYTEDHIFEHGDGAFFIGIYNGVLGVIGGRVSECYENRHGVRILAVTSNIEGTVTHHVPRWLCFHHSSDAVYHLSHIFTAREQDMVRRHFDGGTRLAAQELTNPLVMEYIRRYQDGSLPVPIPVWNNQPGGVGTLSILLYPPGQVPSDAVLAEDDEDNVEEQSQVRKQVQADDNYDVNFRRGSVRSIHNEVINHVMLRRSMEHLVENVSLLAFSRIPSEQGVTFSSLLSAVQEEVEFHYLLAPSPDRRFIQFEHYRQALQISSPESRNPYLCSLCRPHRPFSSLQELCEHYHQRHAIFSPSSNRETTSGVFVHTTARFLLDAYREYYNSIDPQSGQAQHVINPGLPLLEDNDVDDPPNVPSAPLKVRLETSFTQLKGWRDLKKPNTPHKPTREPTRRVVVEGIVVDDERPGTSRSGKKAKKNKKKGRGGGETATRQLPLRFTKMDLERALVKANSPESSSDEEQGKLDEKERKTKK